MIQIRVSWIMSSLLCVTLQVGDRSDPVNLTHGRLGRWETKQGLTVLIYKGKQVEAVDVVTKKLTTIVAANADAEKGWPGMASFSPDGSEITFKEEGEEGGDPLIVFNPQKRTREVLLKMPYLDGPRWSPDGTGIAFEGRSEASGDYSLYLYSISGGKLSTVLKGQLKGGEMLFSWAPDGKRIVFQSTANDICVLDITTGQRTRIDSGWFPTWSPNGRYIAYRADGADDPGYIVYDLQTHNRQAILRGRSVYRSLIWSPDSKCLIYAADGRGEYYGDLLVLDLATMKETRVLRFEESVYPTDWKRDAQL